MALKILLSYFLTTIALLLSMFLSQLLITNYNVKTNYTRKIVHFSLFFIPALVFKLVTGISTSLQIIITLVSTNTIFCLMTSRCQQTSRFLHSCFKSIDRPEDRPKTLLWLTTQTFCGYFILYSFYIIFERYSVPHDLLFLTILSVTIGDGLAEPIGVKFGKRKYSVNGFFDNRRYHRTIEGSLTVYLITFALCILFSKFFTLASFVTLLFIYPLLLTLVEAKSPHTWDTPFLFLVGDVLTLLIYKMNLYF